MLIETELSVFTHNNILYQISDYYENYDIDDVVLFISQLKEESKNKDIAIIIYNYPYLDWSESNVFNNDYVNDRYYIKEDLYNTKYKLNIKYIKNRKHLDDNFVIRYKYLD
jgi:hypothetical protein